VASAFVLLGIGLWWTYRDYQTTEYRAFEVCGREYLMAPGYTTYDYGWQGGEVPEGDALYHVRSTDVGGTPPDSLDRVFAKLPPEVTSLLELPPEASTVSTANFDAALVMLRDPQSPADPLRWWKINYDGCSATFRVRSKTDIRLPRSQEWSIGIYEVTGNDTTVGEYLNELRSSGVVDD